MVYSLQQLPAELLGYVFSFISVQDKAQVPILPYPAGSISHIVALSTL